MGAAIGRRSTLVAVCVFLGAVAGGGWALAAPGGGVIRACANKKTGALRLAGKCKRGEKTASWNAHGPAGPAGSQGNQGPTGNQGTTGQPGPTGAGVDALFGDGSDGDVTISTATTLTRDTYYRNLTIASGQTLNPGGYRIFVSGTLTLNNGSTISRNGANNGGTGLSSGTLGGSGGGVITETYSLGGNGGNGVSATPPPAAAGGGGVFRSALAAISGRALDGTIINGGAAGGGAGGGPNAGAGGGVVMVTARNVTLTSGSAAITADGGDATFASGGGGGGVVVVITTTTQPTGVSIGAEGGTGGPGQGNGSPGFADWLS